MFNQVNKKHDNCSNLLKVRGMEKANISTIGNWQVANGQTDDKENWTVQQENDPANICISRKTWFIIFKQGLQCLDYQRKKEMWE